MKTLILFIIAMVMLILLITKVKLHPFLSMIFVSVVFGIAAGLSLSDILSAVSSGFGGILQSIGMVVVCGVIIGEILETTGGAHKIADAVLKFIGIKRASFAASVTGAIVSIPVFCDSGFIILNPVIKGISQTGNIPYASLVAALMAGLLCTHGLVPPTPGPVAAAGLLGANVGKIMIYGVIISIPIILVVTIWSNSRFIRETPVHIEALGTESPENTYQDGKGAFDENSAYVPSTFKSFMPIVIPIILIVLGSFFGNMEGSRVEMIIGFLGTPWVALMIGVGIAFTLPKKLNAEVTSDWVSKALKGSAEILLITAASGSFSKVLQATDISTVLTTGIMSTALPALLVPFLMALLLCAATGSTTVALTTTAGLMAPLLADLGLSPEMTCLAIAAGSIGCCHSNSSYFWCVSKLVGFDIKQGYRCVTMTSILMGMTGIISVLLLNMLVG